MRNLFLISICVISLAANAQPIAVNPEVKSGKLTNHFTYFIHRNKEPQKRVTLYLVVKAGSILESDRQLGLAHFMEHMSFNGTKHFPKNQLVEYLQKSGIRFGADLNAYTSFDETVYQLPIPTDDAGLFKNGLQIMRDWADEATLEQSEIDAERGVVLEEKRLRKGVGDRLQVALFPFEVNGSRYGLRMPIGAEKVLKGFKHEDIVSFYKDWYRPDLEALIVVGDVDVAAVEKQIRALFGDMKNPVKEKVRKEYKAILLNRNHYLALTDPELSQTSVELNFKTTELPQGTREQYRHSLLRNLCSQLLAARLADLSKVPGSSVLNAAGGYDPVIHGLDALSVSFDPKAGQLENGFDQVYGALQEIKQNGFTVSEIGRVKRAYVSQMEALLREKDRQNSTVLADKLKRHFLTNEPAPGIVYETKLVKELMPGLTTSVINREIALLLADVNRDVVITAPAKEKAALPTEAVINGWIAGLEKQRYSPYVDKADAKDLLSTAPVPGKVVAETKDEALGLTIWKLSNGAKVVLKPTAFKNDEVLFDAFSPGGTSLYTDADYESAANAANIVLNSGLGNHDATALPKLLAGKQLQVMPEIGERFEGMSGGSSKADLETAMQLLYGYFTEPRKDTAAFSQVTTRSQQMIADRYANPQAVFQDTVSAVLGNYNIRRTGPSLQKLGQLSLDRLYTIYKERFANAGDFTFVFTGSFTYDELKPLVERYIASLPGNGEPESAKDLGIRLPKGTIKKTAYAGSEDRATVLLVYHGEFKFSPEEAVRLTALKDVVQFRMNERLREQEGGAYAPSVSFQREHDTEDRYRLVINFGCAPANVTKLVQAAKEEIEKLKNEGPQADDLQKFHAEESRQLELNKQSNNYWLSYLTTKLQNGEDLHSLLEQDERIKAVSAADIQSAAKKYLTDDLIEFDLLPKK